jgi:DNA-binding NarL/FixJ family response regulator
VAVVDVAMPGVCGLEVAARARQECPGVRILILSMHSSEEYVRRALRAGVAGYLLKDAVTAELEIAVRAVSRGETYLSPAVAKVVAEGYAQPRAEAADPLTPRQREVLQRIAQGESTRAMARALNISPKTVETHRGQLMYRLGIRDVAGLVRYALRTGLIAAGD